MQSHEMLYFIKKVLQGKIKALKQYSILKLYSINENIK